MREPTVLEIVAIANAAWELEKQALPGAATAPAYMAEGALFAGIEEHFPGRMSWVELKFEANGRQLSDYYMCMDGHIVEYSEYGARLKEHVIEGDTPQKLVKLHFPELCEKRETIFASLTFHAWAERQHRGMRSGSQTIPDKFEMAMSQWHATQLDEGTQAAAGLARRRQL